MSGPSRRCACGADNDPAARFCVRCGAPLSGAAACGSAAVPAPAAARAVFVGRGADCALRLASDTVSERHAVVFSAGGALYVQDLGSRNGTFLDGARVTRAVPWNGAATLRCEIGRAHV